jgi:peptidoglycan/LPS O-acetylase OafA/YrhL
MSGTTRPRPGPLGHRPALDGVRAVAVLAVVLFHAAPIGGWHLDGGFIGVDIFFALSGYLITTLLLREWVATGRIRLGSFWGRRVRRLVPALVVVLAVSLVAVAVLFRWDDVVDNRNEALASLFYVSNWYTLATDPPYLTLLQHTWSLAIEVQFYAVWPLVAMLVLRADRSAPPPVPDDVRIGSRLLLLVSLGAAMLSTALMAVLHDGAGSIPRVYFGTDTRATPILLGCALAAAVAAWGEVPDGPRRRLLDVTGWLALAGLLVACALVRRPSDVLYEGGYLGISLLAVAFVASAAHPTSASLTRVLSITPLRLLGLVSYGVYLWHWPVFYLASANRLGLSGVALLAVQLAITIAVATASYVLVETPIRQRRWPFTSRA